MGRIVFLALVLISMTACAAPQVVKEASRQQGELLREFQKTLGELQTKLLEFYDEEIAEYREGLLESRMAFEEPRVSQRAQEAIWAIDSKWTNEKRLTEVKKILDEAANYLTQLPNFYFEENYCNEIVWDKLKPTRLREPNERCHDDHVKQYQKLSAARKEVAIRFERLVNAVDRTREAHSLVNEFLQIDFRLTEEQVEDAIEVMEEAHGTLEEAKRAWAEFRAEEERSQ